MVTVNHAWAFQGFKCLSSSPVMHASLSIKEPGLASRQGKSGIDPDIEKHF